MSLLIVFIAFCTTTAKATEVTSSVHNGVHDYFKAAQLQLLHSIEIAEIKIASVDTSFSSRLDVIQYEQHQMLNEIHKVNQSLTPLQSLSLVRKYCIQKYESQLVTRSDAQRQLKMCHDKAKLELKSLTSTAKESVNSAENYAKNNFFENIRSCSSSHVKNETALELCYMEYVEFATKTVRNHLQSAHDSLQMSIFRSSIISHDAVRCTYHVTSKALKALGSSLKDIDICQRDFNLSKILYEEKVDEKENMIHKEEEELLEQ